MATRQKTIEFLTQTDATNLAAATHRDKTVTVYIPETVVAFRSVQLECTYVVNATTAATPTAQTIGLQIAAGTMDTASLGNLIANSGERYGNMLVRDLTSRFTSDWSGTSQTVTCRVNIGTAATANHGFRIRITYDYDDTASTHIKTIRIPIESTRANVNVTTLGTAITLGGATAIPALKNGYLPEASYNVRNAVVELYGTELASSATYTLHCTYGGASDTSCWLSTNTTINSDCLVHAQFDITAKALTAATALTVYSASTTGKYNNLGGWITVTYEFAPGSSTTIFNSLILGAFDTAGWIGGTATGDKDAWERTIYIEEPGTITLQESAIMLSLVDSGGLTLNVAVGSQTNTAFTVSAGGIQTGNYQLVHRIDAGGAKGTAGITLSRGPNQYIAYVYSGTANAGWNLAGVMILNYTSDLSSQGIGAHAQSRYLHILNSVGLTNLTNSSSAIAPAIPESNYWLVGACIELYAVSLNSASGAQAIQAERQSGEGEAAGWETLYVGQYRTDAEDLQWHLYGAARKAWKRHPRDTDNDRMDIETARVFRVDTNPASQVGLGLWYTYHSITFTVSGNITGSNGGTVNLKLNKYGTADVELLDYTSVTGDTSYSFTWYDNVDTLYVDAFEDGTHIGRSSNDVASGTP
jgi:hypothetical protein